MRYTWFLSPFLLILTACHPAVQVSTVSTPLLEPQTAVSALLPSPTSTITPTPSPEVTPTPAFTVCSPLKGLAMDQLPSAVVNPFHPPAPGSDNPHQGVDLADLQGGSKVALAGKSVQAVLTGRVAMAITDRFPYGNAVMIETPLQEIPADWLNRMDLPPVDEATPPPSALTCPQPAGHYGENTGERSLYILYAHMQSPGSLKAGDLVVCGDTIGAVGDSGNALNPHLHLEMRVGPSGARFDSMAHYDVSASIAEMDAYCVWRVGGLFELVDPMRLFLNGGR